ncbi:helix-turn-helix transcriptional regulator [Actinomadura sp. HBU206391]|uniref:helix-turn-helix domain-containing protein n=1 Tax=Actinomadura sp. HBU206391 TaxID=2731692 RepID=UPI00164F8BFF|nr:helix-turn-helix transcriptional regulator [Actinomadura sp. HBU206391]MBC6462964.1 helix-turn-helix transcriptional regulator [Actinomadura sp. HBU206391]
MTSPFVRRRRLATELRTLREEKGMTAGRLSQLLHQSRMKVSRLENAHIRPDLAEIMKILDLLGVTGDKWNEVVRIARDAAERGWWDSFGDAMGPRQRLYADLESGASLVQEYNQTAIPGVLQTPEFTWALVELDRHDGPIRYVPERMAQARLQRQRTVFHPDGPHYEVVLDECVMRRLTVCPAVLRAQLRHLVDTVSAEARFTVRLLPIDARITAGLLPRSSFALYTFPDPEDPKMAVVDTATADLVHTDPGEVARFEGHYDRLLQASLSPADSLSSLGKLADRLADEEGAER